MGVRKKINSSTKNIRSDISQIAKFYFEEVEKFYILESLYKIDFKTKNKNIFLIRGLEILRFQLFLNCLMNSYNLVFDTSSNKYLSLSINELMKSIKKNRTYLKQNYLNIYLKTSITLIENECIEDRDDLIKRLKKRDIEKIPKLSRQHVDLLDMSIASFQKLENSENTKKIKKCRNKVIAHRDIVVGAKRRVRRLSDYNIKMNNLKNFLEDTEKIIIDLEQAINCTTYSKSFWELPKKTAETVKIWMETNL